MKKRNSIAVLRWVSLFLFFAAVLLMGLELILYSRMRSNFPPGLTIGDVPVGGLTATEAGERLVQAYGIPIEIVYGNALIQVRPSAVGFTLNLDTMLAAADLQRITQEFWSGFWSFLWNTLSAPASVPLSADISQERLIAYLENEIVPRYDTPAREPIPEQGGSRFTQGETGRELDINRSVVLISEALMSSANRVVNLPYNRTSPTRASSQNLSYLVRQILQQNQFDGVAEFYIMDLEQRDEISFAFSNGQSVPTDIAFTAASTIKIPIMAYVYNYREEPLPDQVQKDLELMIEISENAPADDLLESIGGALAPLTLTDDLQKLGYKNTFLGGYFYTGAPLLKRYETPANSRTDINTGPDPYNQTTATEISQILDDIYQCANFNGGAFRAVFGESITQTECKHMLDMLSANKTAVLLEAGIPETIKVAHKHGWILESDGLIHSISDTGIIYSPKATYVFTMFFYNQNQLVFDPVNVMASQISGVIYQFFNPDQG
jgi:beta-lactamase class A